jgi:ABC-type bacteriocin/lantibiotic exporter with double-glycine peptidase domain
VQLLPNADQTIINETINISEGQRRRLALARVLYADPDIMLLDEVFHSIDQETIVNIYHNFEKHYGEKTIIISTHLTSFIKPEDRVLLMKEG